MNSEIKQNEFLSYINGFWALLFPDVCKKCGFDLSEKEEILCRKCINELPRTYFEISKNNPVAQLFWGRVKIAHAFSIFYFRKGETLQKLIHLLKYKKNRKVGFLLGKIAGKIIKESLPDFSFDYLVPVPLHPKRLKTRSYNQCELLSQGMSKILKIPVMKEALIRNVYNVSQTKKGKLERWENVAGIFKMINLDILKDKHILIIDDIITTGSTLEACCAPLLEVPNIKISIMSIGYSTY